MEIKAPKTINDLRICHLKGLINEKFYDVDEDLPFNEKINIKMDFIAGVCQVSRGLIATIDLEDLNKLYNHCAGLFENIDFKKAPPKEIIIKDKCYTIVNPDRVSTGWHADWSATNVEKDPVRVACLMYIPKGANYSEVDETGNLKDRIADRYKDFEDEFPLLTFMQASSFFLQKYYRLQNRLILKNQTIKMIQEKLFHLRGKMPFMKSVSSLG